MFQTPGSVVYDRAVDIATGRRALITGGASGFGLEIARRLVDADARVAAVDVSAQALERAQAELGEAALTIRADVRLAEEVRDAVARAADAFGVRNRHFDQLQALMHGAQAHDRREV